MAGSQLTPVQRAFPNPFPRAGDTHPSHHLSQHGRPHPITSLTCCRPSVGTWVHAPSVTSPGLCSPTACSLLPSRGCVCARAHFRRRSRLAWPRPCPPSCHCPCARVLTTAGLPIPLAQGPGWRPHIRAVPLPPFALPSLSLPRFKSRVRA